MNKPGLFIAVFFAAGAAIFVWNAMQPETEMAGHSMTPPDTSGVAPGDPIVDVQVPFELSANAQLGKKAFDVKCAECHGGNGAGQNGVAPPLVHKIYEPNHHSDMAFVLAAKNGVRSHHWKFGNMPPVKGLTDGELKLIARYIRELQKENGIF